MGEVARQLIGALDAHRVPLLPVGLFAPNSRQGHEFATPPKTVAPFDINLICVNADGLPAFAEEAGEEFFEGRHSIGVWWWELSEFPRELESIVRVRRRGLGRQPLRRGRARARSRRSRSSTCRCRSRCTRGRAAVARRSSGCPRTSSSSCSRSTTTASSSARTRWTSWRRSRGRSRRATASGSSSSRSTSDRDPDNHDRLRIAAEPHPHVRLIDHYLPAEDNQRLLATCDAYVSLHRSEGFGIGMAEAMLRGKPVVATAYGGNTDFLTEETGYPVLVHARAAWARAPGRTTPTRSGRSRISTTRPARCARWSRTRRRHASASGAARTHLRTKHSPEAAGERCCAGSSRSSAPLPRLASGRADGLRAAGARGSCARASSAGRCAGRKGLGRPRGFARRAVLRLLRPYTAHADAVARDLWTRWRPRRPSSPPRSARSTPPWPRPPRSPTPGASAAAWRSSSRPAAPRRARTLGGGGCTRW